MRPDPATVAFIVDGGVAASAQVRLDPGWADFVLRWCVCEMVDHGAASGCPADVPPYAQLA
jgi:hypothetical protein